MKNIWKSKLVLAPFALLMLSGCASYGEKIAVGEGDIYYKDGATKDDAQKTGDALVKDGYLDKAKKETSKSVRVLKPGGKYALELVVKDEAFKDENLQNTLNNMVGSDVAAEAFGGAPTELHLCDGTFATRKSMEVEFVQHAKELNLRASKDITADEMKSAAEALTEMLGEGAAKVALTLKKNGDKYVLGILSDKSKWEDKALVESYKEHAQTISDKVFKGAPVQIDFCDDSLTAKASVSNK